VSHPHLSKYKYDLRRLTYLILLALQGASILADRVPSDNSLDVFRFNQWAQAALPFAIIQGRLPTIRKLLRRHDIDVNSRSPKAQPPILIALEYQ
jgi:hypothetical protein